MKTKLLTTAFLLSLLFGENLSAKKVGSGLPGCPVIFYPDHCTPDKRVHCDESQTAGGGNGPGPGRCWDDCSCSKGRYCNFEGANQETGRCEDNNTSKGSKKSMSKGSTPKK